MKRRYAVIGTGAVGGYYGARLQQAGFEVHFLLHSDYAHVREYGLTVESSDRILTLGRVNAHQTIETIPPCDVVLVALKTTVNHALPNLLGRLARRDSVIVMMQNGLGVEEDAAAVVGADRVVGALCFICANKIGPGLIRHLDYGDVVLGEYRPDGRPGGITERLEAIAEDFRSAQIPASCTDDLLLARWKKLVWNIPYNALSVILRSTTDRIMQNTHGRELVEILMREVAAAAAACGKTIPEEFIAKMLGDTDRMRPYKTSMLIDFEAGRPMEIEAIYRRPIAAARRAGFDPIRVDTIRHQLEFLDAVRC